MDENFKNTDSVSSDGFAVPKDGASVVDVVVSLPGKPVGDAVEVDELLGVEDSTSIEPAESDCCSCRFGDVCYND